MKKAFWNAHMFMVECGEALPDHLGLYRYGFRVSSGVHMDGEGEMVSIRWPTTRLRVQGLLTTFCNKLPFALTSMKPILIWKSMMRRA